MYDSSKLFEFDVILEIGSILKDLSVNAKICSSKRKKKNLKHFPGTFIILLIERANIIQSITTTKFDLFNIKMFLNFFSFLVNTCFKYL